MKSRECDAIIDVLDNLLKEKRLGWQCFKDAAKHVTTPAISKLFEKLTLEETDHIEVLMKEKERMEELTFDNGEIPILDIFNESNEIAIPLLDLFKSGDMCRLFEKCSVEEIIALAKKIEVDNFKYLVEAAKKMVTRSAFDQLIKLANEEKEHFFWLQRLENHA